MIALSQAELWTVRNRGCSHSHGYTVLVGMISPQHVHSQCGQDGKV